MATFTASAAQANVPAIYHPNRNVTRTIYYTQSASASIGDVIQMVRIPQGAIVNAITLAHSLSAGVIGLTVGDGNDVSAIARDILISGSSTAVGVLNTFRGLGRSYSVEDTIDIVVYSVSAAPANAELKLSVTYTCQGGG